MFEILSTCIKAGTLHCEDFIGWGKDYIVAIDGASGLTGSHIMDMDTDAQWFATTLGNALCDGFKNHPETSTMDLLYKILDTMEQQYMNRLTTTGDHRPEDAPSAGIALYRQRGDQIEYFGLGDCVGIVKLKNGQYEMGLETNLSALDEKVIQQMTKIHKQTNQTVLEARQEQICKDMLLKHRMLRNQENGYWILDLSKDGLPHARTAVYAACDVESLSVCSDGFAQLVSPFAYYPNYERLHEGLASASATSLVDTLFQLQEQDPDANNHPRLKFRDDTCVIFAQVKE